MKRSFLSFLLLIFYALVAQARTQEAQKIDVFGNITCEGYLARADSMLGVQSDNPNSKIYVFVYEGKQRKLVSSKGEMVYKSVSPQFGLAPIIIKSIKARIKMKEFPLENYVFVSGGFRENFEVEIWLVPSGAESPKPTPTLEKMKYRKGKPIGFCLYCCG